MIHDDDLDLQLVSQTLRSLGMEESQVRLVAQYARPYSDRNQFRMSSSASSNADQCDVEGSEGRDHSSASTVTATGARGERSGQSSHANSRSSRSTPADCRPPLEAAHAISSSPLPEPVQNLERIDAIYDRRSFTTTSQKSVPQRGAVVDSYEHRPANTVFPEDPFNKVRSRFAFHKTWCPADDPTPRYFDADNVQKWFRDDVCGRSRRPSRAHSRPVPSAIVSDFALSVHGDPGALQKEVERKFQRLTRTATHGESWHTQPCGCRLAAPVTRKSPGHFDLHTRGSTLPRDQRVDRVARFQHYRRRWEHDGIVQSVVSGNHAHESWRLRFSMEDHRRKEW